MTTRIDAALTRSRIAVAVVFALNGFLAAMLVAHIPVITARTGVTHETLGGLLLLTGASAFVGMQVCGPLIDRFGSRPLTIIAVVTLAAAIFGPVLATGTSTLAPAVMLFGFANGSLDVSMNSQAVAVEQAYDRPIMSAFHAYFSVGSMVGSAIIALTLWLDVGVVATVAGAAVFGVIVLAVVARDLTVADVAARTGAGHTEPKRRWWHSIDRFRFVVLATVAFALMLAEGTAYDWSALQVVETFGVPDATGAIAFFAFSVAMTATRFVIDPIAASIGPAKVVRIGATIGAVGMTMVVLSPAPWVAVCGWLVFGGGLAGGIPQIFTAAGNLSPVSSGQVMSAVVGCGYLGMLAGPAVVGFLSHSTSLASALAVVIVALALALVGAGQVNRRSSVAAEPR
ncbi:MFS transporter [Gordonia asplenii]|uniref:MFS transporter n=1 Tax=Gordonia asplenii TaxID=2725283 RepID=UPI0028AC7CC8|nr:MFS transporter [Gordonia asplenii]